MCFARGGAGGHILIIVGLKNSQEKDFFMLVCIHAGFSLTMGSFT